MKKASRHPLFIPLLLGFILRVTFLFVSQHLYYPDELYQSLEQAFRLVNGYGIFPWDFAYGLRSYTFPLLLAGPLYLAKFIGITDPSIYRFFPQITLVLLSLLPIAAVYQITLRLNKSAALFAAYFAAIWYELIYFSGRALTEVVAVDFFALAVLFLYAKKPKFFLAGLAIGAATLFRLQYFPIALILFYLTPKKLPTFIGGVVGLIIFGIIDQFFLGSFLSHPFTNLKLSLDSGISAGFGTHPYWLYLGQLFYASGGLWLLIFYRRAKSLSLWISLLTIILLHSLIPHKEYRFIYLSLPLLIILVSLSLNQWKKIAAVFICLLSLVGMLGKLPGEYHIYEQPPLLQDPEISLYSSLYHDPSVCGIYDSTRNWVYTPGYFFLNRQVPLYDHFSPPPKPDNISHYLSADPNLNLGGFIKLTTTESYDLYLGGILTRVPGISLYRKTIGACTTDPNYSTYRSSPNVESTLTQLGIKKL